MNLRRGIRHFNTVKPAELAQWVDDTGTLSCTVTEKTDGMAFSVGHDPDTALFYTRTAHSPRTYDAQEYRKRAIEKFGDKVDLSISDTFILSHNLLLTNPSLKKWLVANPGELTGEVFLRAAGMIRGDEIKFVGTWYKIAKLPNRLTFVVHSETNSGAPIQTDQWTTVYTKIDDDRIELELPKIDVSDREASEIILSEFFAQVPGKWGDTEGFVLHKEGFAPIKLMNPSFYINKRTFNGR